jgi:catechol 2,3-dioxygenase-like lactoylglutathione lyase family enzyme
MSINVQGSAPLIQVFDMPTSLAFYRDKLGFEVAGTSGDGDNSGWVMLKLGEETLMLNTQYEDHDRPPAQDPARRRGHRDTTIYFGCPDVDAAYQFLRDQGVSVDEPEITGYGFKAVSVTDPDGYGICFHWPVG